MPLTDVDPVFIGLLVVIGLVFFFGFLLVRRTLLNFRDGFERGRKR